MSFLRCLALVVPLAVAACGRSHTEPERAVMRYAQAIVERDCWMAWSLLSTRTREAYEAQENFPEGLHPVPALDFACEPARMEDVDFSAPRTVESTPDRIQVMLERSKPTGPALPGFNGMLRKWVDEPILLVREGPRWLIEDVPGLEFIARKQEALDQRNRLIAEQEARQAQRLASQPVVTDTPAPPPAEPPAAVAETAAPPAPPAAESPTP